MTDDARLTPEEVQAILAQRERDGLCLMCGRKLDVPGDELSLDCGGDCHGCMLEIEREFGDRR